MFRGVGRTLRTFRMLLRPLLTNNNLNCFWMACRRLDGRLGWNLWRRSSRLFRFSRWLRRSRYSVFRLLCSSGNDIQHYPILNVEVLGHSALDLIGRYVEIVIKL
jgi:hypothetical protein